MRTARGPRGMSLVPSANSVRATLVAVLLAACSPSFQPKQFHTNTDLFAASMKEYERKHWDNAITGFERLTLDLSPRDTLLPHAHWFLAVAHEGKGEHLLAAASFLRLAETFPDDSLADDALLNAGDAYARLWRDPALDPQYGSLAQLQYRQLASIYPDSPLADSAQKRSAHIDDLMAQKDYNTAVHYVRRKCFDCALIYLKDVVKNYQNSLVARDALMRMVEVYRNPLMNYRDEAAETCVTLRTAYPADPGVIKLCPGSATADSTTRAAKPAKPAR